MKSSFLLRNMAKTVTILAGFLKLRIVAIVACLAVFSGFSANSVLAQETVSYTDASGVTCTYQKHIAYQECILIEVTNLPASVTKWVIPEQITFSTETLPVTVLSMYAFDGLPHNNMTLTEIETPKFMSWVQFGVSAQANSISTRLGNLRKLTFGEELTNIEATQCFSEQPLETIIFKGVKFLYGSTTPTSALGGAFTGCPSTTKVIVPCGTLDAVLADFTNPNYGYWHGWQYNDITWTAANFEEAECLNMLTVLSSDEELGNARSYGLSGGVITSTPDNTTAEFTGTAELLALPKAGVMFVGWDDDNTDNPRTVVVDDDVTYIAIFAECDECEKCEECEECEECETCPGVTSAGELGSASTTAIQVYPNPADNLLQVELAASATGHLTLYDMSGKSVFTQSVTGTNAVLNIGSLASGSYILRLVENGIAGAGVKVIKN